HERRGEAMLAARDAGAAASAFHAAAQTQLRLGNHALALSLLERALTAQGTHPEALELKARLALDSGDWADAVSALQVRVQQGGTPGVLSRFHVTLGGLYQDALGDTGRAAAHLQTALSLDAANPEALERLASLHGAARNWAGAQDCLKRRLELGGEASAQVRHMVALARVLEDGFGDVAQAMALYRRAMDLAPHDGSLADELVRLHEQTGDVAALVQLLETQAASTQDPVHAQALRLRAGDLYARSLNAVPQALGAYRAVVEADPRCAPARVALAELYARDAGTLVQAVEEHRQLLRLEPTRMESLHALFRLWHGMKLLDRAYCVAGVLHFLRAADDVEAAFFAEARSRPQLDASVALSPSDVNLQLRHPAARSPLAGVLRAVGDQLSRLYPPTLETAGVDRRADRLKPEHPVHKAIRGVADLLAVDDFDVYQSRRGVVFLETTEPLSICVGQDVVRKFNAREQRFLIGRVVLGLLDRTAVLSKLSVNETADLLGAAVRIHHPDFAGLGRKNEELTKQLRRAASRKS
ncbi:MAG: Adventurous gliding motility protein K, partial [Myxococcaceae bacterium]|nr:Adventurous gliding motility protein K [Myxococcaceae bacterium]